MYIWRLYKLESQEKKSTFYPTLPKARLLEIDFLLNIMQ